MSKSNVYHTVSPPNHASQCAMLISRQFLGMKFFFPDKDLRSDGEVLSAAPGFGCYAQKKPGNHPHLHWPRPLRSLVGNVRLSETLAGSRLSQNAIEMVQDMSMLTISHDPAPWPMRKLNPTLCQAFTISLWPRWTGLGPSMPWKSPVLSEKKTCAIT